MRNPLLRVILAALAILAGPGGGLPCPAAPAEDRRPQPATVPEVKLTVASGRHFRGQIDASSGPHALVLRQGVPGLTLWRPIAWERIVAVEAEGQPVSLAQLRRWVLAVQSTTQPSPPGGVAAAVSFARPQNADGKQEVQPSQSGSPSAAASLAQDGRPPAVASDRRDAAALAAFGSASDRVVQLQLDASVANWDGDVEVDGLAVEVMPRAADGTVVPVAGTLEVELWGLQRREFWQAPRSGGDTLELIERWTRAVRPEEVGPSGVRALLPFGAVHPELQANWPAWWYGLVHVRLSVPGQGVFEASRDGVRLRPWSPVRDRLERAGAGRILPTERLGRPD